MIDEQRYEERRAKVQKKPTAKLVLTIITSVNILVVATATIIVSHLFALGALSDLASLHAIAVAGVSVDIVQNHLQHTEKSLLVVSNSAKSIPGYVHPSEDFVGNPSTWDYKWGNLLLGTEAAKNFTDSGFAIVFDDGSLVRSGKSQTYPNVEYLGEYIAPNGATLAAPTAATPRQRLGVGVLSRSYSWHQLTGRYAPTYVPVLADGYGDQRPVSRVTPLVTYYDAYDLLVPSSSVTAARCAWFPPTLDRSSGGSATTSLPSSALLQGAACTVFDTNGRYIALAHSIANLTRLDVLLRRVTLTEGARVFVVAGNGSMIAGVSKAGGQSTEFYASDSSSASGGSLPPTVSYTESGFAPLSSQPLAFVAAEVESRKTEKTDGKKYYIVSVPVAQTPGFGAARAYPSLHVVYFLPEADLIGGINAGLIITIICAVALFIAAVIASFLLMHILMLPIKEIADNLLLTARMENLTKSIYEEEETGDENDNMEKMDSAYVRAADSKFDVIQDDSMQVDGQNDNDGPGGADDRQHQRDTDEEEDAPDIEGLSALTEIAALQVAYHSMDSAVESFTKYVPREVVRDLLGSDQLCEIAMKPMRCTMLFVDIASFTTICEKTPVTTLSYLIRQYFERQSRLVMLHGGIIDKFIGDCIFAVWSAPHAVDHQELRGALCAKSMLHEVGKDPLKSKFNKRGVDLNIRVGVATGTVLAGNMGMKERMSYTCIGDNVNLAARLESLNKQWGTGTMLSDDTATECHPFLVLRLIANVTVVGKDDPVDVWEVLGVNPDAPTVRRMAGQLTSEGGMSEGTAGTGAGAASSVGAQSADFDEEQQGTGPRIMKINVNRLMKRAKGKFPASAKEMAWANYHTQAINAFKRKDFKPCLDILKGYGDEGSDYYLEPSMAEHKSVRRILDLAEVYVRDGAPDDFNGVIAAHEK